MSLKSPIRILHNGFVLTKTNFAKPKLTDEAKEAFANWKCPSETAKNCLRANIATTKEWASKMNVSERAIQQWISTGHIPDERVFQIILFAKKFLSQLDPLEHWIDEVLAETYGALVDPNVF